MNIIDRAVAAVSPERGLKRTVARKKLQVMNSGYSNHGASRTKKSLLGWLFRGGSPDEDIIDNLETLRQRSRDLYMGGATLATGALKTARTNIIGTGLRLKPAVDADFLGLSEDEAQELKRTIDREFSLWAGTTACDAMRMDTFYQLQQLACLSYMMSGDVFGLLPIIPRRHSLYDLRVRLVEADRCSNPQKMEGRDIVGGVECDSDGAVVAYHFANKHPLGKNMPREWTRVEVFGAETGRRNVIHMMEKERPEQRRGVPFIAPVIESLKQLGRYTEAELMAAVVSGMFTVFIQTENAADPLAPVIPAGEQVDRADENSYELGNGAIIGLGPGETANTSNPGRPNTAFDGFVTSILRQVGSALEIPYELLVKNFTSSYSASRAALLEAWKAFRMRRSWLSSDFCQPIYEEWFAEAVAKGRIPAPGFFDDDLIRQAYTKAEWHGPSPGQLDPLKEVQAAEKRIANGLSTGEREAAEINGSDYEQNHRQLVREKRMRADDGLTAGGGGEQQNAKTDDADLERDEDQ
ncbi:phage portal protein [Cohnella sp. GCM10012308]|uniref:phage portal protein n=1 Tax=Cohnella sp. GCM10012308 TaxID=3317329 RepID=UPI0036142401